MGRDLTSVSQDVGSYLTGTFGDIPKSLLGLLGGDWLVEAGIRRVIKMRARTLQMVVILAQARIQSAVDIREQVSPLGIRLFDQADLPSPVPVFEMFFAYDGRLDICVRFHVDKTVNFVSPREG